VTVYGDSWEDAEDDNDGDNAQTTTRINYGPY